MSIKTASFLAMIGTLLLTILLVYDFISTLLNVMQGLVPAVKLFSSLIYAFASITVACFFFVFHKQQN
jgi:hypothetical protein